MTMIQNKLTKESTENRGQVGIGTLIVFIALVLVAAIAAGVLINTAGFLQSQAESTGEESTDQVSNGIQIQSSTAEVSGSGDIQTIELRVGLTPGSDPVDLSNAALEWVGESAATTEQIRVADSTDDAGSPTTTVSGSVYVDENSGSTTLETSQDTETIVIATDSDALVDSTTIGDLPMTENNEATVTISTQSGGETTEQLIVPSILENDEGVNL